MSETPPATPGSDDADALDEHEVRPVDNDRLVAWLRRTGQRFFVGGDDQLGGLWNGCVFTFMIVGQGKVLQIRGQLNRVVTIDRREELIELINARHARAAWPKCSLMVLDDGTMRVVSDHSTLVAYGLSERQLDRAMRVGLASALAVFSEINTRYPDPLAQPPESLT